MLFPGPPDYSATLSIEQIRQSILLAEDELQISAIQISSPGFFEFLGGLNPLEQFRRYLNDRHERLKDNEYRKKAEAKRLRLENERLAAQVFAEQAQALKQAGLHDDEVRRVMLPAAKQLGRLGELQDAGLIGTAEIKQLEDKRGATPASEDEWIEGDFEQTDKDDDNQEGDRRRAPPVPG